jgi:hypothetical protein
MRQATQIGTDGLLCVYPWPMPWRVTAYEPTPNPQALKCVLDGPIIVGSHPFRRHAPAVTPIDAASQGHTSRAGRIAELLFEHPTIQGLLICHDWITINRADQAPWPPIKKHLERVLQQIEPLPQEKA